MRNILCAAVRLWLGRKRLLPVPEPGSMVEGTLVASFLGGAINPHTVKAPPPRFLLRLAARPHGAGAQA